MYTPNLGIWLQRDPAEQGTNLYRYAENSPIDLLDPYGLAAAVSQPTAQPSVQKYTNPNVATMQATVDKWTQKVDGAKARNQTANVEQWMPILQNAITHLRIAQWEEAEWNRHDATIFQVVNLVNGKLFDRISKEAQKRGVVLTKLDPNLVKAVLYKETRLGTDKDYKGWMTLKPQFDAWKAAHDKWEAGGKKGPEPFDGNYYFVVQLGRATGGREGVKYYNEIMTKYYDIGRQLSDAWDPSRAKDIELTSVVLYDKVCLALQVGLAKRNANIWKTATGLYNGAGAAARSYEKLVWDLYTLGIDPYNTKARLWSTPKKK